MKRIILILMAVCCTALFSACGKRTVTYRTEDYISISVSGVDGKGSLHIETCTDEFLQKVNRDIFDGRASDIDLASMTVNIAYYAEYAVEGQVNDLSNGDKITITMQADNESLRELGLEFALNDYSYTVSGLAEPVELDVWTGLELEYDGIAPNGSVKASYNGTNDFVKKNVWYDIDRSYGLSNGDTVKITAKCNQSALDENLYLIGESEKEFTVEGLSFYADNLNGFDLSEIDVELFDIAKGKADSSTWGRASQNDDRLYGYALNIGGLISKEWSVRDDYTVSPVRKYFYYVGEATDSLYSTSYTYNAYTVFYEVTFHCVMEKENSSSGYNKGDVYDLTVYLESHITNLLNDDGELSEEKAKTGGTLYSANVVKNYMGLSLNEIAAAYEEEHGYTEYKRTDIN